ncbi:NAD(P)/FAD-dependent oxidoreductase [Skermania sp. ID1734]|uniref:flavin-containing monooxygenase n=1 Tax=Skermania sp. ID1734 TaxID=2597516 RepID=UPI00117EC66D|nr:NAD(P)/FAD-dependent oxidoreductase [Skermania sp. ID1734]TSD99770.1 NAD(P)/FAD-dependent oxidoreductase [Skermania sp. ID1734]
MSADSAGRHVDVLILGAGLSGIDVAAHLVREKTGRSFTILDRRDAIGGTWDLFRYPGIRSDSDMFTFGFGFRPWHGTKILADGPHIRQYLQETADEYGITDHIRFRRKVTAVSWSSADEQWTVRTVNGDTGDEEIYTSNFLACCTGYYNYDEGFKPAFPGEEDFTGQIIHPQHWPADLDYRGKRVVVIGSGATAITLIPAMADDAEHVTMLQRSPTYIVGLPSDDPISAGLKKTPMPQSVIYKLGRARNIAIQRGFYELARAQPNVARKMLLNAVRMHVGPDIDMRHFTPTYKPWDQRLCVVPNGDLFKAVRSGKASIVTDRILKFTETGIKLESGEEIPADIIVSATGLNIQVLGGASIEVDGKEIQTHDLLLYKGVMLDGMPNAMIVLGYTNASWTLKADLAATYFARLLNHMRDKGYTVAVPHSAPDDRTEDSLMGASLTSGYIQRGNAVMPRQGSRAPWKAPHDYYRDMPTLRHAPIEDGVLEFSGPGASGNGHGRNGQGLTSSATKLIRGAAGRIPFVGAGR